MAKRQTLTPPYGPAACPHAGGMAVGWTVLLALALAGAIVVSCGKRDAGVGESRPASAPARPGPVGPDRGELLKALEDLEAQGLQAEEDMDHGRLARIAEDLARLELAEARDVIRRDRLVGRFRERAAALQDAMHRFLFVELEGLGPEPRRRLLAAADRGEPDAIANAAAALAEHHFNAGKRHLRATPQLPPRTQDALTGLPVRWAGDLSLPWQRQFNEAFNAHTRRLQVPDHAED